MANYSCDACEELRQTSTNFVVNGITDTECASLANDTGLSPSSGNNDCTDLNNINDCLVGNMEEEVEAYDVCDWKEFMKKFIPNLWTTLKAIICAICGIWEYIHCFYDGFNNLVNAINSNALAPAFVRYYRDNSAQETSQYRWALSSGANHTLDIYMNADVDSAGNKPADRDYVVICHNCTDIHADGRKGVALNVTYYSSGDNRSIDLIEKRLAQHPELHLESGGFDDFSWTTSGTVLIKKGEHIKLRSSVENLWGADDGNSYWRIHQVAMTWIPINIANENIDIDDIINCDGSGGIIPVVR